MRSWLWFCVIVGYVFSTSIPLSHANPLPDETTIRSWLGAEETFEIRAIYSIFLPEGEQAYVVDAYFEDRARCCMDVTLLARPHLQCAREIPVTGQYITVMDLDHNGISEVEAHGTHPAQGYLEGRWQIYSFDGWTPVILYDPGPIVLSNELAGCGLVGHDYLERACERRDVYLEYEDINLDGMTDVIETIEEETFWYKPGTDEEIIYVSQQEREQKIDQASYKKSVLRSQYLYSSDGFIKSHSE